MALATLESDLAAAAAAAVSPGPAMASDPLACQVATEPDDDDDLPFPTAMVRVPPNSPASDYSGPLSSAASSPTPTPDADEECAALAAWLQQEHSPSEGSAALGDIDHLLAAVDIADLLPPSIDLAEVLADPSPAASD